MDLCTEDSYVVLLEIRDRPDVGCWPWVRDLGSSGSLDGECFLTGSGRSAR